jgi:hypothetical protein
MSDRLMVIKIDRICMYRVFICIFARVNFINKTLEP